MHLRFYNSQTLIFSGRVFVIYIYIYIYIYICICASICVCIHVNYLTVTRDMYKPALALLYDSLLSVVYANNRTLLVAICFKKFSTKGDCI